MPVVPPAVTVCVFGLTVSVVTPHAVTTSVLLLDVVVLTTGLASVAVTVNVYVPGAVTPQVVAIVRFEVALLLTPAPVTGFVAKVAVAPAGKGVPAEIDRVADCPVEPAQVVVVT